MKFFFHYNKPLSKKLGKPMATIHYKGGCFPVEEIKVNVPTRTKVRKQQPYFVVEGDATDIVWSSDQKRAIVV